MKKTPVPTFLDNDAVIITANKLGLSTDDVISSIRDYHEYERIYQSQKAKRSEEKRKAVYAEWLRTEKEVNPLDCYCEEEGIRVERKYEEDGVVGYFMRRNCSPYDTSGELYQEEYYKCSRCGKRYILPCPAYA